MKNFKMYLVFGFYICKSFPCRLCWLQLVLCFSTQKGKCIQAEMSICSDQITQLLSSLALCPLAIVDENHTNKKNHKEDENLYFDLRDQMGPDWMIFIILKCKYCMGPIARIETYLDGMSLLVLLNLGWSQALPAFMSSTSYIMASSRLEICQKIYTTGFLG